MPVKLKGMPHQSVAFQRVASLMRDCYSNESWIQTDCKTLEDRKSYIEGYRDMLISMATDNARFFLDNIKE